MPDMTNTNTQEQQDEYIYLAELKQPFPAEGLLISDDQSRSVSVLKRLAKRYFRITRPGAGKVARMVKNGKHITRLPKDSDLQDPDDGDPRGPLE